MKLTPKQQAFADYYIQSGNATDSARKAGYSEKTSVEMGYENLRKPHIKQYIEERNKQLESTRIADAKEIKTFWTDILRSNEQDLKDRLKASEYLAKTNALFIDKVEQSGELGIKINIGIPDDEDD